MTDHLVGRVWQHPAGLVPGFTKTYGVKTFVWYEVHETRDAAILRERQIKKWKRRRKPELIERENPAWNDLAKELTP
jgi:putative endonuclease